MWKNVFHAILLWHVKAQIVSHQELIMKSAEPGDINTAVQLVICGAGCRL